MSPEACCFGYRTSSFREFPDRFLILSVTYALVRDGRPKLEYRELRRALGIGCSAPSLAEVRRTVLDLRRSKSKAGFTKGLRRGAFGISSAHALALVHHGGGTSEELVALARDIREGVRRQFDIELQPEPVFLGFPTANPLSSG